MLADTPEIPLIGASIPRSGHHHLARLLQDYFGSELRYCPVYDAKDCCLQAPCVRAEGRRIVFQKSHDFAFRLPTDLPGVYLIQHRRPLPNALSGTDLRARRNGMRPPSESLMARWRFHDFLGRRLAYYKRFHDKWIASPPARSVLIEHGALEADPAAALRAIAAAAGLPPDEARIAATTERLREIAGPRRGAAYKPRVVEDSPFFERETLAAYEAAVVEHCPDFGYDATLGGAPYRTKPFWWIARLRYGFGRPLPPGGATSEFE